MSVGPIVDYLSQTAGGAGDSVVMSFYFASGSVAVGDVVAFSQPDAPADATVYSYVKAASTGDTGTYAVGVALEAGTYASSSIIQVQVQGPCLANVSSSVSSAPAVLAVSATGGRAVAISAATSLAVGLAVATGSNSALTNVYLFNTLGL